MSNPVPPNPSPQIQIETTTEHKPYTYAKRTLYDYEQKVVNTLKDGKSNYSTVAAYCTTVCPIKLFSWSGAHPASDNMIERIVPAGTTLRITMVSRFNDFGLTDDLEETHKFQVRIPVDANYIADIRDTVEPSSAHTTMAALVAYHESSQNPQKES